LAIAPVAELSLKDAGKQVEAYPLHSVYIQVLIFTLLPFNKHVSRFTPVVSRLSDILFHNILYILPDNVYTTYYQLI